MRIFTYMQMYMFIRTYSIWCMPIYIHTYIYPYVLKYIHTCRDIKMTSRIPVNSDVFTWWQAGRQYSLFSSAVRKESNSVFYMSMICWWNWEHYMLNGIKQSRHMTHKLYIASWHFVASEMSPVLQEQTHPPCYTLRCKPSFSQHITTKICFYKILPPSIKKWSCFVAFCAAGADLPICYNNVPIRTINFLGNASNLPPISTRF
jgi:hypothetical protein